MKWNLIGKGVVLGTIILLFTISVVPLDASVTKTRIFSPPNYEQINNEEDITTAGINDGNEDVITTTPTNIYLGKMFIDILDGKSENYFYDTPDDGDFYANCTNGVFDVTISFDCEISSEKAKNPPLVVGKFSIDLRREDGTGIYNGDYYTEFQFGSDRLCITWNDIDIDNTSNQCDTLPITVLFEPKAMRYLGGILVDTDLRLFFNWPTFSTDSYEFTIYLHQK